MHETRIGTCAEEVITGALVIDWRLHAYNRIGQHHEIRPTVESFVRVSIGRISWFAVCAQRRCEVPTRGEANDAELSRVNTIFGGVSSYVAHGAHTVVDLHWILIRRHTVIKDKCCYALGVQPARYLNALVANCNSLVAAAWNDQNRRIGRGLRRDERVEFRLVGFR